MHMRRWGVHGRRTMDMSWFSFLYSGKFLYLSNSTAHSSIVEGSLDPVSRHSVWEIGDGRLGTASVEKAGGAGGTPMPQTTQGKT